MGQNRDGYVATTPRGRVHVDGVIARRHEAKQQAGEPFGKVTVRIARETRPGINGRLIEWRLEIEAHGDTVFGLESQQILHQHADNIAGQIVWPHLRTDPREDLYTTDLVAVNRCPKVEPGTICDAIDQ